MELALLLGLAFAANKAVSVLKSLLSPDRNAAITQVIVWGFAFGFLLLGSEAEVLEGLIVPGLSAPLGTLDIPSIALLALVSGSTGSVVYDFKKAFDNTDTAAEAPLTNHEDRVVGSA